MRARRETRQRPRARRASPWLAPWLALLGLGAAGDALGAQRRATHAPPCDASRDALALRLNIPAFRLDVLLDGATAWSYGVAVGEPRHRTPTGTFEVRRVVWNPWWIPPDSPWARDEHVTPPGPGNPMGRVKLLLGGPYYLHGTPLATSIGRAASHGCIRMRDEDAMALAQFVQLYAGVPMSDSAIDAVLADSASRAIDLPAAIPLDIVYEVAEVRRDSLLLHPDVYRLALGRTRALAMLALHQAGHDTMRVRRDPIALALRRARTRRVAVPLDDLLTLAIASSSGRTP